jgi:ketohexokinase
MARILIVGNATLDIVNQVESYPHEDQEVRATAHAIRRGGNAANSAVVLSQLGHQCYWCGTLADEPDGALIRTDLLQHNVKLDHIHNVHNGKVPTSYIVLSRDSGSRTIVHYRDLPEYPATAFAAINLTDFDWLHFEGRNVAELKMMLTRTKEIAPQLPLSLEVEKERAGMEELLPLADLLLFSRDYAEQQGAKSGEAFLQQTAERKFKAMLTCSWGDNGAYAMGCNSALYHSPAHNPAKVIDTLGAGDVFNAGIIDQLVKGESLKKALSAATRLAGIKCGVPGLVLPETALL